MSRIEVHDHRGPIRAEAKNRMLTRNAARRVQANIERICQISPLFLICERA